MVYCGKPSKGCSNCRERKIRCDQKEPGCGQCDKREQKCPGYRNLVDLMFRDESSHVIKKAKAKARRKGLLSVDSHPSSPDSRGSRTPEPRKSLSLALPRSRPRTPTSPGQQSVWSQDSDGIMSPEAGNWPVTPALALVYNLTPTLQENGYGYFLSRYVNMEETACHQKFDFLRDVWKPVSSTPDQEVDGVLASMTAVGLMGLANLHRANLPLSRSYMEAAQKSYGTALRLMNRALADPAESILDSTMLTVLILGVFEMTSSAPATIVAFREHVNGAAALAIMRGPSQFSTLAGRRMFAMLCQRVVISCLFHAVPFPPALLPLLASLPPTSSTPWEIPHLTFSLLALRASLPHLPPPTLIDRLLTLDAQFASLTATLPPSWTYKTLRLTHPHPAVLGPTCHLYPSLWHATAWNALRTARILLLETLLSELYMSSTPLPAHHAAAFAPARTTLRRLVSDIAASLPHHLGLVNPSAPGSLSDASGIHTIEVCQTPSPPTSPASSTTTEPGLGLGGLLPSGLTLHDVTGAGADAAGRFMLLVSAPSTVVWPVYVAGMSDACGAEVKGYFVERLRVLYMETGIRQADAVAGVLGGHEGAGEWLDVGPGQGGIGGEGGLDRGEGEEGGLGVEGGIKFEEGWEGDMGVGMMGGYGHHGHQHLEGMGVGGRGEFDLLLV